MQTISTYIQIQWNIGWKVYNIYSVSKKTSPTFLTVTLESIVGFS